MSLVVLFDLFVVPQLTNTKQRSSMIILFTLTLPFTLHCTKRYYLLNPNLDLTFNPYPIIAPTIPPTICAILEILSWTAIPSYTCCPIKIAVTNINIIGISPSLKSVNEASRIKSKTAPLYFLWFFFFSRLSKVHL